LIIRPYQTLHRKSGRKLENRNIRNAFDLDNYSIQYKKFKDVRSAIVKKLKLGRNLTEYEEAYVEKWVMDYNYDFDIIELALKKDNFQNQPKF